MTWIPIAGWTLVHFVWQGALLAAIAALGLTRLAAATPEARYTLAGTTLALMLLSPILTASWLSAPHSVPAAVDQIPFAAIQRVGASGSSADPGRNGVQIADASPWFTQDRMFAVLVTVWLFGVALLCLRLLSGWWQIRRIQRTRLTAPRSSWQTVSDRLARQLGVRQHVQVVESSAIEVPGVFGWWRPLLLLPITAFAGLTPSQAEAVLTHELAHVRRHDYVVNVLQHLTETVLFYHPAVWWISHRMRVEREHCCDVVVVGSGGDVHAYAAALVHIEVGRTTPSSALAMAATTRPLLDRIRRMLNEPPARHQPMAHAVVTTVMVLCFVLLIGGTYRWLSRVVDASTSAPSYGEPAAMVYDVFMKLDVNARQQSFRELTPANQANVLREQVVRWQRHNASRLTTEQRQILAEVADFIRPELFESSLHDDGLKQTFMGLERRASTAFTPDESLSAFTIIGPYLQPQP